MIELLSREVQQLRETVARLRGVGVGRDFAPESAVEFSSWGFGEV